MLHISISELSSVQEFRSLTLIKSHIFLLPATQDPEKLWLFSGSPVGNTFTPNHNSSETAAPMPGFDCCAKTTINTFFASSEDSVVIVDVDVDVDVDVHEHPAL